ncbi:MAG: CRISPR-associated endonuclease Cas3'' [Syntrophorhabdaceae bacterium]|nr:CRISPR-associated endonuclease Cas3'' [Syntrophorhabdaceae bacterium]
MDKTFYAHSKKGEPPEKWQRLEEHLENVAEMARGFAQEFGAGEWGYLAGLWHDLGKFAPEFQNMLRLANGLDANGAHTHGRVNHSTAGAILAVERFKLAGRILSYLVAGHHAGLSDWASYQAGNAALSIRLNDIELLESVKDTIPENIAAQPFPKERPVPGTDPALWIRMLFSCLVDSDFLDTEAFISSDKGQLRGGYPALAELLPHFETFMKEKLDGARDTPVNRIRAQVLNRCRSLAGNRPGIYTLTVPTGGGKTLSSMAFALHHALLHRRKRIIYVIPYTSIIEQTADQFRKIFGSAVIEHHSNFDTTGEDDQSDKTRLACENWDAPIVVTTSVQFFESLFANRSSRCRKLHNIINSVIVFDEVQLLPPEFLKPILDSIAELQRTYNATLLLCTATQPAFGPHPEFGFNGLKDMKEVMEDPGDLYRNLKRAEVRVPDNLLQPKAWEDLASELSEIESVLCVVNRRDDCRELWKMMPQGTFHLSALMCGAHRSRKIAEIKDRLAKGLPTRVISTQLVEAGVDVDFPVVYRAVAGLDSVAQAAGRCNREGRLEMGRVIIFCPPSEPPVGHLRQAAQIGRRFLESDDEDFLSPDKFTRFFEEFYWLQADRLDIKGIMDDLAPDREFRFSFRSAAQNFTIIDEQKQGSVLVTYGEGAKLISLLEKMGPQRWLMRKLQRYVVNLPRYLHTRLVAEGAVRQVYPGIFTQGHSALYREDIGFCPEQSIVYAPDDLIC